MTFSLIEGREPMPERHRVDFLRWQIVAGQGIEKRVLRIVDVGQELSSYSETPCRPPALQRRPTSPRPMRWRLGNSVPRTMSRAPTLRRRSENRPRQRPTACRLAGLAYLIRRLTSQAASAKSLYEDCGVSTGSDFGESR
jgi:hypothetical protein